MFLNQLRAYTALTITISPVELVDSQPLNPTDTTFSNFDLVEVNFIISTIKVIFDMEQGHTPSKRFYSVNCLLKKI